MMKPLRVNFVGGQLVIYGPVTGRRYFYDPSRDNGVMWVDQADVPELLKKTMTSGCNCGEGQGQSTPVQVVPMFEE